MFAAIAAAIAIHTMPHDAQLCVNTPSGLSRAVTHPGHFSCVQSAASLMWPDGFMCKYEARAFLARARPLRSDLLASTLLLLRVSVLSSRSRLPLQCVRRRFLNLSRLPRLTARLHRGHCAAQCASRVLRLHQSQTALQWAWLTRQLCLHTASRNSESSRALVCAVVQCRRVVSVQSSIIASSQPLRGTAVVPLTRTLSGRPSHACSWASKHIAGQCRSGTNKCWKAGCWR